MTRCRIGLRTAFLLAIVAISTHASAQKSRIEIPGHVPTDEIARSQYVGIRRC